MQRILGAILLSFAFLGMPLAASDIETRVVVDQRGVEVTVPVEIKRLVVVPVPLPSVIFAIAGSGESVIGMRPSSMDALERGLLAEFAPEMLKAETAWAEGNEPNLEELLKLNPDVVMEWDFDLDRVKQIEDLGIPVIVVKYPGDPQHNLDEWFRIVGELYGQEERAAEFTRIHREMIGEVSAIASQIKEEDRTTVMLIGGMKEGLVTTFGGKIADNFWMQESGGINVSRDEFEWISQVSMEQILAWNPEVILINNFLDLMPQDLYENNVEGQDWSHVSAVQNQRVYKVPDGIYRWGPTNTEWPMLFKWVSQKLTPEKFADTDMTKIVRDFYAEVFSYDLNDEQIRKILHADANGD